MKGGTPNTRPTGAAFATQAGTALMDVTLHIGAHRTATTTFQHVMRQHLAALQERGIGVWGPERTRKSVFPGLFQNSTAPRKRNPALRAQGRARMLAARAAHQGLEQLLVSDENMLGSCVHNIRHRALYPAAGERMARVAAAFGGRVTRIVLSVRAQDLWWSSAMALAVERGHPIPTASRCAAICDSTRTWRDVITDIACAVPDAEICVTPFETFGNRPQAVLAAAIGGALPHDGAHKVPLLNPSADLRALRARVAEQGDDPDALPQGDGRWQPFTQEQAALLAEHYADDMHWLIAGADGLATLTEDTARTKAETHPHLGQMEKGHGYDDRQGHVAQSG
ncbi:hypothetical protein [Sulfitobacter sp. JB4-11]|uniref:hypothetical protein n=1 Tax=Sulfitobacter rhodophyticola TaxID=3238304 RepID=UPI003D816FF0